MRSSLTRATFVVLVVLLITGCATSTPAPTVAPTQVAELPTQTPYPTATAYPTYTPYPTATIPPTNTPVPPTPTATATATLTPTPSPMPVTPKPAGMQSPAPVGSADLWRTPGAYKPVGANLCATYGSSFAGRDWQETFCVILVEVNLDVIRFYGQWDIRLVKGTPAEIMFHPNSRDVVHVVDNLGLQHISARLGGAAEADVKVYGKHTLLGYKDNDNISFPHVPSAWWEFEPAKRGATSFTFVNDKYGFRIGPITLSK